MSTITISNLSFTHDNGQPVFDNVSLQLDSAWNLGLIGRNGRGKTTFLKLLHGEYTYSGTISTPLRFDYFPFPIADPARTPREIARALCPEAEDWQLEREADLIRFPLEALERPFNTLSGGEATKVLLAALFLRENSFPLIDEPTNHLDAAARLAVARYLRGKKGFILVSHDRALLDGCVDHILSINRADIELQRGNFSSWQENQLRRERFERAEHDKLQRDAQRLEQAAKQSENWAGRAERGKFGNGPVDRGFIGHKAAKMMQRAKNVDARRQKAFHDAAGLLKNMEFSAPLTLPTLPFHSKRLAEAAQLSLSYGPRSVFHNISFHISPGERLLLQGHNGSGKSSILKLLAGLPLPPDSALSGNIHLAGGLRVSYVPQDASFLRGPLDDFARDHRLDANRFKAALHRLGFERGKLSLDLARLSAGQQKKILLARSLCQQAHLYIWDEPLNYIDILSRVQLEDMLLAQRPAMVFVEHDQTFARRVASTVLNLDEEGN